MDNDIAIGDAREAWRMNGKNGKSRAGEEGDVVEGETTPKKENGRITASLIWRLGARLII